MKVYRPLLPATYAEPPETYELPPTYDDPSGENFNSFFDQRVKPGPAVTLKPAAAQKPVGAFAQPVQQMPVQPHPVPVTRPTGIFAGAQPFQPPMNHANPRHPFMPTQSNSMFQSQPIAQTTPMGQMRPNQPVFQMKPQTMAQQRPAFLRPNDLPMPLQEWLRICS